MSKSWRKHCDGARVSAPHIHNWPAAPTSPLRSARWAYRLRWKRREFLWRAWRSERDLTLVSDAVQPSGRGEMRLFVTLRNELPRLKVFFEHYRAMGVDRFFVIDNGSTDGSDQFVLAQPDAHLWRSAASYKQSRFGMDWMNALLRRYGHGGWCVCVDADERLILPAASQELRPFIATLDAAQRPALGAVMIERFPKGPLGQETDELWFDPAPLHWTYQPRLQNIWIRGGIRARAFFADQFERAPTLNKLPLIKWDRRYAFVNSVHSALPVRLNHVLGPHDPNAPLAVLLHDKFAPSIVEKSAEELQRRQHFQNPDLYQEYHSHLAQSPSLWFEGAVRYRDPSQFYTYGFMRPLNSLDA